MTFIQLPNRIVLTKISKVLVLFIFIFIFGFVSTYAQTGLNFQGVARGNNNVILASQQISLRLSVLQGSTTGTSEYTETRTVTTNAQGLFTVVIGDVGATSTLGNFTAINWKNTPKFLKIEMDAAAGNNFITMGTTQFQYVAYAQFANSVDAENIAGIVPVARGGTGATNLATFKSSLAIDKINNTADADKPISTKTQTALDLKLNAADTSKYTKQSYTDSSLATKLKLSDTATMLSNRIGKDTLSLSARINFKANTLDINAALTLKANASDVATNLSSKLNNTDTSFLLQKADTITLSNRIDLKANSTDVATSLGGKVNTSDVTTSLASKVDKVIGKELSTNDYSNAEKTKLAAITGNNTGDQDLSAYATTTALSLKANALDVTTSLVGKVDKVTGKELSTNDYTTAEKSKLAAIVGTNTGDQDLSAYATNTALALKANTSDVLTGLANKVDKITGKELSTNDYTNAEKTKLAAIAGINTGDQDLTSYATNTALALKVNTSDVNTSLALKASMTDVATSLLLKEDASNKSSAVDLGGVSPSDILFPTQKAVKDYVTANNASGGISDGSVTTIKLDNLAVTDAKLASGISKSKVGLGNVENTELSTWVGTNNITTLGTIATGTWSGTAIAIASGGTGVATTTANTFFAGPNGTSGAPSFRTLVAADLPNISTLYIQNTPDATQTGSINISGNAKIGTALNVNGIYFGIGKNNQNTTNTAIGNTALQGAADGYNNTTMGIWTMKDNNGGYNNTSVGANALQNLSTGYDNTAIGNYAMLNSTTGDFNTATGSLALSSNTSTPNTGSYNVANGYKALPFNQTGSYNVGVGYWALQSNTTGTYNTAIGNQANVASASLTNATAIGNGATVNASNRIQLGNALVELVNTSGGITAGGTITANGGVFTSTTISGNETVIGTLNANAGVFTNTTISGVAIINGKIISGASSSASPSALVEVNSTTQGFLPPRMTLAQRNAISSPAAGLMIWCSDNFGGEIEVFNGTKWVNMNGRSSNTTLSIGDYYQGGRIAYILASGDPGYDANIQHGLIAATSDQSSAIRWYNGTNTSTGATGTAIGTGLSNTNAIIASQGETATSYAAGLARAYNGGGYTDWYLPSYVEVQKIFLNRVAIGGFGSNYYWSSTEDTSTPGWIAAWAFAFEYNPVIPINHYKSYGYGSVRAIRAF